jgi:HSP20 family protein
MKEKQVDINEWQSIAQQVLGEDFFKEFMHDFKGKGGSVGGQMEPRYNIYRNSSEVFVVISLPYIRDISQVQLSVRDTELLVKGEVKYDYEHLELIEGNLFSGPFEKVIPLPVIVNTKRVNAQYKRGILQVQLFPRLRREGKPISIQDF